MKRLLSSLQEICPRSPPICYPVERFPVLAHTIPLGSHVDGLLGMNFLRRFEKAFPRVFILVLNYNGKEDTLECLRSVEKIRYPNYRTVVLDNASVDGSIEAIRQEFPGIDLVRNRENLGFAKGNNMGIRYVVERGADYIFLLNNDTVVDPGVLDELVKVGEADPRTGILGPVIYRYHRPDEVWSSGGRIYWTMGIARHIVKVPARTTEVDFISGCALMVKSSVIEQVGLFDPDFFLYYEDADWSVRVKKTGYKLVVVPTSVLWHKEMKTVGKRSPAHEYYVSRNNLLFMDKHASPFLWTVFWPAFALKVVLKASWFVARGQFRLLPAIFLGIRDFFAGRRGKQTTSATTPIP